MSHMSQEATKRSTEAFKMSQRRSKDAHEEPWCGQEMPKTSPEAPKDAQDEPESVQEMAKRSREAPKTSPDMPMRRPKGAYVTNTYACAQHLGGICDIMRQF